MLFTTLSTIALAALATVTAAPVADTTDSHKNTTCRTITKGYLIGTDIDNNDFRFSYNSAHEVAYHPSSGSELKVEFQECPNYEKPTDPFNMGRLYVPSLNGCVSNPAYAKNKNAPFYPKVTPCDKKTSTLKITEQWRWYPWNQNGLHLRNVYWVAFPDRVPSSGCDTFSYKTENQDPNDLTPYTRPGHDGAIELVCDLAGGGSARFQLSD